MQKLTNTVTSISPKHCTVQKNLDSSKLTFEEIRQLFIKDPKHSELKNPVKFTPPQSVLLSFARLIDCQTDYLLSLGDHAASLPDFIGKGCLHRDTDGNVCYKFGDYVKFDRKEYLLMLDEKQLSQTLSSATKRKSALANKSLYYTPQKGLSRNGRKVTTHIKTSTPRYTLCSRARASQALDRKIIKSRFQFSPK